MPRAMSARRCSRRSPDRRESSSLASPVRIAFLVPARDYPEPWRWAFDVESEALIAAGAEVEPLAWTEADDLSRFDLVLPLVAWGYHLDYARWLAFLDRIEESRVPMINPPSLLRWNSD